jgi:hypothetical protein
MDILHGRLVVSGGVAVGCVVVVGLASDA